MELTVAQKEEIAKARVRTMQGESALIMNRVVYKEVRNVLEQAELNSLQTDFKESGLEVRDHFWRVTIASMQDLISDHSICSLEVRNWFELQGIWA